MSRYRGPRFKKIRRLGALPGLTNKGPRAGTDLRNQSRSGKKSRKLLDRYPTSEPNSFWLKNIFLVALEQLEDSLKEIQGSAVVVNMLGPAYGVKSIRPKKKYLNINLIDIVDLIFIN